MKPQNDEVGVRLSAEQKLPGDLCQRCGWRREVHELAALYRKVGRLRGVCEEFQEKPTKRPGELV